MPRDMYMRSINGLRGAGFTLIELVMGIVLIAIALGGMLGLLINQSAESTEPVQQVREFPRRCGWALQR